MKTLLNTLFLVLIFVGLVTAQTKVTDATAVNGWECLPGYDIHGNLLYDASKTYSQIKSGYQTFNTFGNTYLNGQVYLMTNYKKRFFSATETKKIQKYVGFDYRVSGLVGNVSEIAIGLEITGDGYSIYNKTVSVNETNPVVDGWKKIKLPTDAVTNRIKNFYSMTFLFWVMSSEISYVGASIDIRNLIGVDSLGNEIVYDNFQITKIEGNNIPFKFELSQNYPNPFNPATKIQYFVPIESGPVTLKVYDLQGREVATLVDNEQKPAGIYEATFDAGKLKLSSGTYFYRLQAGNFMQTKKMSLVK